MMFLRYESFREYLRYYPINSIILAIVIGVHAAFIGLSYVSGIPVPFLQREFGAFTNYAPYDDTWRYVTSVFMHGDFGHLLFNAFAIFVFAAPLERFLGHFRYLVLFLVSGVFGNVFTQLFYTHEVQSVGASGAIYGVFGAFLYVMLFHRRAIDDNSRRTLQTLLIIGFVFSIIVPRVNVYAHLGGLAAGFVLIMLYIKFRMVQGRGR
jgi:rhomboid protease GluP